MDLRVRYSDGRFAKVVDVWDWLEARAEKMAEDILSRLVKETEDRVSLCWGVIPWLKAIDPLSHSVAEAVSMGGGKAFISEEFVTEVSDAEGKVLMVAANPYATQMGEYICMSREKVCYGDLASAWHDRFEDILSDAGWYIEGDEGDGSQGWLVRA